jgi:hypothetical protein
MCRAILALPLAAFALAACWGGAPEPPPPEPLVRVDTVVVTREVAPPLGEGRTATICLANGQAVDIRVDPAGDTLVGPRRVRLADLGPAIGFVGNYAGDEAWFLNDQALTFDRRTFRKFGQPEAGDCFAMKIVGDFNGVNLFAETITSAPFRVLYVPVRPGVFQPYQSQVGRVRG